MKSVTENISGNQIHCQIHENALTWNSYNNLSLNLSYLYLFKADNCKKERNMPEYFKSWCETAKQKVLLCYFFFNF